MTNSGANAWPITRCNCGAVRIQFERVTVHITEEELLLLADGIHETLYRSEHQEDPPPHQATPAPLDVTKH